jgi:FMN phosphatase YigB (HAD superfamily)
MDIRFVYFDLGNVLVSFDPAIACRKAARLLGIDPDHAHRLIYASGLQTAYERGEVDCQAYVASLRRELSLDHATPPSPAILDAISDMFTPIDAMLETVHWTRQRAGRIGVLSNTCAAHWNWIRRQRWPIAQIEFDATVLSYEVLSMKPDSGVYEAAEQAAGVLPHQLLFLDDKAENVAAARRRGWNAECCHGGPDAAETLRRWLS